MARELPRRPAAAPSSSGRTADFGSVNRGSNPRGAATPAGSARIRGDVVKWFNTEVCKTSIHRFESGRRLHNLSTKQPAEPSAGLPYWATTSQSESRIDGLALEGQHSEHALVNTTQR